MSTWYHRASWALVRSLGAPRFMASYSMEVRGREDLPSGPYLLLANHANALDPYVLGSFLDRPPRYMANLEGVSAAAALLGRLGGAYAKRKGRADQGALRQTLELAAAGETLGIFPEGDRTWDGSTQGFRPGLGRLVKRLGLPVVLARQSGGYLCGPRWAIAPRRGPWRIDFSVMEPGSLAAMADPALDERLAASLRVNEIKDHQAGDFQGRGLALGIGRLLYRCPVCGRLHGLEASGPGGDRIRCRHCASAWDLDGGLRLVGHSHWPRIQHAELADLKDWADWQASSLGSLLTTEGQGIEAQAGLALEEPRGRQSYGQGKLSLRPGEFRFESPEAVLSLEPGEVKGFVDHFNKACGFSARGQRYRVDLRGGNALLWIQALEALGKTKGQRKVAA